MALQQTPQNRLLVTEPGVAPTSSICDELEAANHSFDRLLCVSFDDAPMEQVPQLAESVGTPPSEIGVIQVTDAEARADVAPEPHPELDDTAIWASTLTPFRLTDLQYEITSFLERATPDEEVACLIPLAEIVDRTDQKQTVHFLNLITPEVTDQGATPYYHLEATDEHEALTELSLFDEVIDATEATSGGLTAALQGGLLDDVEVVETDPTAEPGYSETAVQQLQAWTPWLWITAIATFGFGDIFTTVAALENNLAVEASPIAANIIAANGLGFIYIVKVTMFALFFLLWWLAPEDYRVGVPLGLSLLGIGIFGWNLGILIITVT